MCDEYQKHLQSQLKHVLVNNWNQTDYITNFWPWVIGLIINLNIFYSEKYWKVLDSRTSLYISSPLLSLIMIPCNTYGNLKMIYMYPHAKYNETKWKDKKNSCPDKTGSGMRRRRRRTRRIRIRLKQYFPLHWSRDIK